MNSPRSAISQSTCIFLPSRRSGSHIFCLLRWGINQWKTAEPWAALGNSALRAAACTVVHSSANNVKAWCWCNSTGTAFLEQPSSTSCLGPPSSLGYTHGHRTRKGQALTSNGQRRIWGSSVLGLGMPLSFLTWERVAFTDSDTPTHPVAGHYCFGEQGPSFNTLFRRISPFSSMIQSARSRTGLAQALGQSLHVRSEVTKKHIHIFTCSCQPGAGLGVLPGSCRRSRCHPTAPREPVAQD